jgi:diguanylate cyclase (GGDEF)-like protein
MYASTGTFSFLRYASLWLIVLTLALLTWHRYGMDRVFIIAPGSGFHYEALDDRVQGGDSIASVEPADNAMVLNCRLGTKYTWPYCQMVIRVSAIPGGIDFTPYDSITFDVAYTGPGLHSVRFYLRNFEPDISSWADHASLKVNEVEFPVSESGKLTVPLKFFRVASWWVENRNTPLMSTDMRINKVPYVELSTGGFPAQGVHRIEIKSIQFNGKWISQKQLVMALVGAWLMFSISWLIIALQYFRANLLAAKLRLSRLQSLNQVLKLETKELAGQVRTDPLTGALNRAGLREFLMTQWQSGIPAGSPLCVIFADLDHFKDINDRHGHGMGDRVLQEFTALVQNEIRSHDRLVRWGGEEFLILCQDTRADQGEVLAEKLRAAITRYSWPENLSLSCSFGVTMNIPDEDFGVMIARADRALYNAKKGGRDRVEVV